MNYSDIRKEIRSGDLLAWSHEGWSSWHDIKVQGVRMATRSNYSHVALPWVVGDRVFVLEAVMPLVRIYPLSKLGNFYWLPMHAPWKKETEELALSHIGDEYSQWQAIKAFFRKLDKGATQECAAYVTTVLNSDGINLGDRATPDAVVLAAQKLGSPLNYIINRN